MRDVIAATPPALMLVLAAVGWALVYLARCRWRPFAPCWCCKGSAKHFSSDGKSFRLCWWCGGSGRRKRTGRRVWDRFAKVRNASQ
ncbi:hypothetical protein ABZU92_18205 [Micromonospora arida]|uniref:hypothetical protein n=1 Tax=Micromonospora arida TaxID=2203715 RepID=UPI0033B0845B